MKKGLIRRILVLMSGMLFLALFPLSGQRVRRSVQDELPAFDRIVLGGDFSLEIRYGKQYHARMAVEELFADYVQFTVEDSTLIVTMDERKVPGEVRKLFRGKDSRKPEFRVEVTMPETLGSLLLEGHAALVGADDLVFDASSVDLSLKDNARIESLALHADRVRLSLDRKADAKLSVRCDSLFVQQTGASNLELTHRTSASSLDVSGASTLLVKGETGLLKLDSRGFAKSILNGSAPVARYQAGASAQINAVSLANERSFAMLSGAGTELTVAAGKELTVDLSSGASVYFLNDPTIRIVFLKNASLIPYDRK